MRHLRLDHKPLPASQELDLYGGAGLDLRDHVDGLLRIAQGRAVDADHDVAGAQAGLGGRPLVEHGRHQHAAFFQLRRRSDVAWHDLQLNAQPAAGHIAVVYELPHHIHGETDGNGEANALGAAAAGDDGGVDADQLPGGGDQGAAGIARIDVRVGLYEVLEGGDAQPVALRGADYALSHRLTEIVGVAYGQHHIAHLGPPGVA